MSGAKNRQHQYLLFIIVWAVVVLIASVQPSKMMWKILPRAYMHDLAHTLSYGFFAYLFCFYLRFYRHFFSFKMTDIKVYIFSFLISFLWGGSIELIQILTKDRRADWWDCFHNAVGASIGILIFFIWHTYLHHRHFFKKSHMK